MQGTAVAYDLANFGEAKEIKLGDFSLEQAEKSAARVNSLSGKKLCSTEQVDALNELSLRSFIDGADVLISCVPYWMHPKIAPHAIASKVNMVDMGGDTRVARKTLTLHDSAKAAGVSVVPDTGLAPGLVNSLGTYLIEHLDETDSVKLYCGGLPQNPRPPFNYKLVFNIEGLITEYMDEADVVRDGKEILVPTLEELEAIDIEGVGHMEAFVTSGGTSTATNSFAKQVRNYEYKTIRYPGHCAMMKLFKDFGFWSNDAIQTRSGSAIPREVFCALMSPRLKDPNDTDMVIVRACGVGKSDGKAKSIQIDILQKHDQTTGFSAMEQLTGYSTAIYAAQIARGKVSTGCVRYELAMSGTEFVSELCRRPIHLKIK